MLLRVSAFMMIPNKVTADWEGGEAGEVRGVQDNELSSRSNSPASLSEYDSIIAGVISLVNNVNTLLSLVKFAGSSQ